MQVTEETEQMRFNTGISALMEFVNAAYKWDAAPKSVLRPFVLLLAPYAPHIAEELWQVSNMTASKITISVNLSRIQEGFTSKERAATLCLALGPYAHHDGGVVVGKTLPIHCVAHEQPCAATLAAQLGSRGLLSWD